MPRISIDNRKLVVRYSQEGVTQKEIAKVLNISRRSVQYIIKKFKLTGDVKDRPKSGRNRILSDREERRLVRISKGTPTSTAREVRQEANMENLVSLGTVRRTLRRNGLFGRIAIRKPYLSEGHRRKRFAWSHDRLSWSVEKWGNVVFSDECKLELNPNRRIYVRRNIGSRLKAKYIRSTVKFPRYIMVWGAIRGDGARVIVRCNRNVDSLEYQRVLRVGLPHVYCPGCAFQQDGAPAHRSSSTTRFLSSEDVRVLGSWPAQSPDLNVSENVWHILKEKVFHRSPHSLDDLWSVIVEEWNSIPRETIRSLYNSIPRRLSACVAAKGGHTKY